MCHLLTLVTAPLLALAAPVNADEPPRPNFIFFITDDISPDDLGPYGNEFVRTPNLDRMASRGLVFDNAYLTISSCSPSRCSIITGRYPHNTGAPELHTSLPADQTTFVQCLRDAGYHTVLSGKNHMAKPQQLGFDVASDSHPGGSEKWVKHLRDRPKDKPFFCWFASHDAHRGFQVNDKAPEYDPARVPVPPMLADGPGTRKELAGYHHEVSRTDHYLGLLQAELERQGIADQTYVIYCSDNGRPFPRCKTYLYESGIQTPLLVTGPGVATGRSESIVSAIDFSATILDLAGVEKPGTVQGVSFAKVLEKPAIETRTVAFAERNWHVYQNHARMVRCGDHLYLWNAWPERHNVAGESSSFRFAAVRELWEQAEAGKLTDAQALLTQAPQPAEMLFNVRDDPHQFKNLAGEPGHAETLARMRSLLDRWKEQTGDSIPANPTPDRQPLHQSDQNAKLVRGEFPGADRGATEINHPGPVFADPATSSVYPRSRLREIPFHRVRIDDSFWNPRLERLQERTLPGLFDTAEEQGKIDNFRIVAGRKDGRLRLYNAPDSDVYKLIEATAYSLAFRPAPELRKRVEGYIGDILAAQDENGYLHTQYMLPSADPRAPADTKSNRQKIRTFGFGPEDRWTSLAERWPYAYSQLYCAGHFFEAAVAWHRATGDRRFLDGAVRFADHIDEVFGEGIDRIRSYADHPQIEIGLMKLYEVTHDPAYLSLAERFSRHVVFSRPPDLGKGENRKPLHEQRKAYGHAVRTAYIYAGATDVVRATGAGDLGGALDSLWKNITGHKMYLHGGTGNGSRAEQHGHDDDLPLLATYSETCANIAQGQWHHRLNLLTGHARHADLVELESYNSALSGISLDGGKFFYSNKLNLGTEKRNNPHHGLRTHYLFCCPAKVPGFLGGLGRWIYATDGRAITVNQYVGGELKAPLGKGTVRLRQRNELPWKGRCEIEVLEIPGNDLTLRLRVPFWLRSDGPVPLGPYRYDDDGAPSGPAVSVNGRRIQVAIDPLGYISLDVTAGDRLTLDLPPSIRRVVTDDRIPANRGRVALMRGPLLYCLEGVDHEFPVRRFVLPDDAPVEAVGANLLDGVTMLRGRGRLLDGDAPVEFTAVPYFAWQNRGIHDLATLLIRDPETLTEETPPATEPMNTNG